MQNGNAKAGTAARPPVIFLIGGLATVLFFFPPAEFSFYPRCLFHSITGWDCPGCGSLRAAHQLLHGNFETAFSLNPLFVTALPVFIFLAAVRFASGDKGKTFTPFLLQSRWLWPLLALAVAFGILRNIPAISAILQ